MSYVKKHLKVRAKCLGDGYAELTLLVSRGEFGSKEARHRWTISRYPTFLHEDVRLYNTDCGDLGITVTPDWFDDSLHRDLAAIVRLDRVGYSTCRFPAKLWPKIKAAVEEYNRYGEEEYQKYLHKEKEG